LAAYNSILFEEFPNLRYVNWYAREDEFHPDWRVTLDYPEDLNVLKAIMEKLNRMNFTYKKVIDVIEKNPEILELNKNRASKIQGTDRIS
jgi:spore coat polysaccharide biosynthesis protein SpsF (cytidylyltransferase family)